MADERTEKQKVQEITDKLEEGLKELFESEKYKTYLSTMSKFHNYSFNNTLLIAMQKLEATLVAGYKAWQKNFERHVNKGEKAIRILAPAPYKIKEERDKLDPVTGEMMFDENGMPQKEQVEVTIPAFRVVSVFDVSQTDGKPIPELEAQELLSTVEGYEDFVQALMNVAPVPIGFEDIPGDSKGYFHTEEKRIAVQENMSESQTLKTMVHEVVHSMLHNKEINRDDLIEEPAKDRNTKEVEAESVAYTVCQHFGIDTSDYSFGYIAGWSSGKEMKELKSSLDTIRKTASELITGIEGALRELQLNREMEQEQSKECILLIQNEDLTEFSLVNVRGMDTQELLAALSNMSEDDKLSIQAYLESKGAWTTELGNEKSREFEEYHLDVRYNLDTDEVIDVKAKIAEQIDSNLSVMEQAEQLINQLEVEKTIFTSDERNLIVNYAYKLDDMDRTRELAEKLAYQLEYAQQDVGLTIIDAQAEIDALPDLMIGLSEMREYGYTWNEMLPLTQEKALEFFSTHSLELLREIKAQNIYYLTKMFDGSVVVTNPCYPAYATRNLYGEDGYGNDMVVLVEDDLAKIIIEKIMVSKNIARSIRVKILPTGGWTNTITMAYDVTSSNLLNRGTKLAVVLDRDIKVNVPEFISNHKQYSGIKIDYLPIACLEKYLKAHLVDKLNNELFSVLDTYLFQKKPLNEIIREYIRNNNKDDSDGKAFYGVLLNEVKSMRKDREDLVDIVVRYILEHEEENIKELATYLSKKIDE